MSEMSQKDDCGLNTQVIHRNVRYFFWLNIIPLAIVGFIAYWFWKGELTIDHFPKGTEKLLWLSVLSAVLMVTLIFLTLPFSVWLRRSTKRSLKRTMPSITGERGLFSFLMGVPLLLLKLVILFLSWCFCLVVIAMIGMAGISFLSFFGYAIYENIGYKSSYF